ncbi:MAG: hypothetical protein M3P40_07815 [Actinomycetota bacterium]|nr:hypothetical protein [Actinomycetota bacterium]
MRPTVSLAAVIAAGALAGCGAGATAGEDFDDQEQQVAEAIGSFQEAAQRRDTAEICRRMFTPELAKRLADGSSCERELELAIRDIDAASISVTDVAVEGTSATAQVKGPAGEGSSGVFELVKRGDTWRIEDYRPKEGADS